MGEDEDFDELDDEDDAELLCGLRHDGYCGNAGTEYCDFECPFRDEES